MAASPPSKQNKQGQTSGSRLAPLMRALENFFFSPPDVTAGPPHVRDGMDLQRMMVTVALAITPAVLMAMYNTGLQVDLALARAGVMQVPGWRGAVLALFGLGMEPAGPIGHIVHGALYFMPVFLVSFVVGGLWEAVFAVTQKHPIYEGFIVTSLLFPLTLPADIPLWQAALGISFGIVIGKEVFGGVGMNILNPALTGRAFLFFAYPAQLTGDHVWVPVDGISRATPLAELAGRAADLSFSLKDAFFGLIPGSMGETSTLACLLGAALLLLSRVASWRIMTGVVLGAAGLALTFNLIGSDTNPMFAVTPIEHFVLGGFAFGTVYMATDPVSACHSQPGQWVYGLLIGALTVMIRVINPGFAEGVMLAILFGNICAPIIDRIFINRNVKRRAVRYASQ